MAQPRSPRRDRASFSTPGFPGMIPRSSLFATRIMAGIGASQPFGLLELKCWFPPISAVRFTEGSVDAPTPPVNLYNQKSHVLSSAPPPSARSVPCWNLGDAVSNQTRIAIGFLEPAV